MTDSVASFLGYGVLLGLSAGISPGPLLTLVISRTLEHGPGHGMRVAAGPLITDLPIIAVALLLFSAAPRADMLLGIVSLLGAAFVFLLGVRSLGQGPVSVEASTSPPRSLLEGSLVNLLNPHPYLFWFGVGVPTMIKAARISWVVAAGFAASFLVAIVGSKMALAMVVGRTRGFLAGRPYLWLVRSLGLALIAFALLLVRDGLRLLTTGSAS